jgi:hypothetical protein
VVTVGAGRGIVPAALFEKLNRSALIRTSQWDFSDDIRLVLTNLALFLALHDIIVLDEMH